MTVQEVSLMVICCEIQTTKLYAWSDLKLIAEENKGQEQQRDYFNQSLFGFTLGSLFKSGVVQPWEKENNFVYAKTNAKLNCLEPVCQNGAHQYPVM